MDNDENNKNIVDKRLSAKVIKVVLPMLVSAALVVWLFKKVDVHQVMSVVREGVDWKFIIAMMVLTILSQIIRGVRWGYQLRAAGIPRMTWLAESVSIFGAYALNLLIPYGGEAWRCIYVSRHANCKLSTVVGTDLGDRGSDGVMISMLLILTLIVARQPMERFMTHYQMGRYIDKVSASWETWIIVASVIAVALIAGWMFRRTKFMVGVKESVERIWEGFSVLFTMKGRGIYVVMTFGIWICYYLETYCCFYAFDFTRALTQLPGSCYGLIPGLVVFVFGSCSMAVPSNGGLGAWNVAVMFALGLYGIRLEDAAAYSLVVWCFQALTEVAAGVFSMIYIGKTGK